MQSTGFYTAGYTKGRPVRLQQHLGGGNDAPTEHENGDFYIHIGIHIQLSCVRVSQAAALPRMA